MKDKHHRSLQLQHFYFCVCVTEKNLEAVIIRFYFLKYCYQKCNQNDCKQLTLLLFLQAANASATFLLRPL